MQVFRLVNPGFVDRVIAFDSLPESLLTTVRRAPAAGFPRHWRDFLGVDRNDQTTEPFYTLDYITRNADKEKWSEIVSYVKRTVDPTVRLLDKVEAMAAPLAESSHSDLTLEPEQVPIIPVSTKVDHAAPEAEPVARRGRPRKVEAAV